MVKCRSLHYLSNPLYNRNLFGARYCCILCGVLPIKLEDRIYKTIVKPAMIYGSECWAIKKNDTQKLHTTEMRMLRWVEAKSRRTTVHVLREERGDKTGWTTSGMT